MVRDHVLGVDRGVSHRCVHSGVTADLGRDVRGQPGADGVGDEDPPKIVGPPLQRLAGSGDLRGLRGGDEALPDQEAAQQAGSGDQVGVGVTKVTTTAAIQSAKPPRNIRGHGRLPRVVALVVALP
jgi:hypothetical protein